MQSMSIVRNGWRAAIGSVADGRTFIADEAGRDNDRSTVLAARSNDWPAAVSNIGRLCLSCRCSRTSFAPRSDVRNGRKADALLMGRNGQKADIVPTQHSVVTGSAERSNGVVAMPSESREPMMEFQRTSDVPRDAAVDMFACSTINTIMAVAVTARNLSVNGQRKVGPVNESCSHSPKVTE